MIRYKEGYKYQLVEDDVCETEIRHYPVSLSPFLSMDAEGVLTIKAGYAWDGPSGPALDTSDCMRASLVHDALYQLLRARLLPQEVRMYADEVMFELCLQAGMPMLRAQYFYHAVLMFAEDAADPRNRKPILTAPG